MNQERRLTTVDIVLAGVFSALWAILNLTLGPLGFAWFGLPIFCDFAVFFTLLLAAWATGKFGVASLVGIVGSVIVLAIRPVPVNAVFAISAIVFDLILSACHHKLILRAFNMTISALAVLVSAYLAGAIIGTFFMNRPFDWALLFWGGWHTVGGVISLVITLPIIGILERANVRKINGT